jgi:hypothetical protein
MRVERRGDILTLLCSCCNLPFAKVQFGRLVIQSKHHGDYHSNSLGPQDLAKILAELAKNLIECPPVTCD